MTAQAPLVLIPKYFIFLMKKKEKYQKRRKYVLNEEKAETVRLIF